jgi:hypothetical protein
MSAAAVLIRVEFEKFPDLLQCEAGGLRLPDEAQAAQFVAAVPTDSGPARWGLKQGPALVTGRVSYRGSRSISLYAAGETRSGCCRSRA